MLAIQYEPFDDDDPYPLGVPNRVVAETNARVAEWLRPEPLPAFKIDCAGMQLSDCWSTANRAADWLLTQHVEHELVERIRRHVMELITSQPELPISMRLGWSPDDGWYVTVLRHGPVQTV
jgi:hypothetical protein